jgi:phosphoesterase RecJ-like protein
MSKIDSYKQLDNLIQQSKKIVIIQADNPDGDSLGSALALEQILGDLGKETHLYCRIDIPSYLKYLKGWDRVDRELPKNFDMSILVDCNSISLLENSIKNGAVNLLSKKPFVILDHHIPVDDSIDFASLKIVEDVPATGQLIFEIAKHLKYRLNLEAADALSVSIMSDTLGLTSQNTTSNTIRTIAELVDLGVDLTFLDEARRSLNRKSPELIKYKGQLLQRIEFYKNNEIAVISIPWEEIEKYSNAYNPSMLVMDDMRLGEGTMIAIAFKSYPDGRITAKIRSNLDAPMSKQVAEHFGGGGHDYASGFKIDAKQKLKLEQVKANFVEYCSELIDNLIN